MVSPSVVFWTIAGWAGVFGFVVFLCVVSAILISFLRFLFEDPFPEQSAPRGFPMRDCNNVPPAKLLERVYALEQQIAAIKAELILLRGMLPVAGPAPTVQCDSESLDKQAIKLHWRG